jgi:AraC-like DNA-binding protein
MPVIEERAGEPVPSAENAASLAKVPEFAEIANDQSAYFSVSSQETGGPAAFHSFHEAVAPIFDIAPVEDGGLDSFSCAMSSFHLNSLMIGLVQSDPLVFERSASLLIDSGIDHLLVQLYIEGGFSGMAADRPIEVEAGDICIFDLSNTLSTRSTAFSNVTFLVPRTIMAASFASVGCLHGLVLKSGEPQTLLLADYIKALAVRVISLSSEDATTAARSVISLLANVICGNPKMGAQPIAPQPKSQLLQITQFIKQNLSDPTLGAVKLAQQFDMSRATLYRLFEPLGSVAEYIRHERLAGAAIEISALGPSKAKIAEIARRWGFDHERTFNRAFKLHFGLPPSAVRQHGLASVLHVSPREDTPEGRFRHWIRSLRDNSALGD